MGLLIGVAALGLAADPIEIQIRSVWGSLTPGKQRFPFIARILNNTTQDAQGRLLIQGQEETTAIPVDVAKKSFKDVPIFPIVQGGSLRMAYDSNVASKRVEAPFNDEYVVFRIALIGDTSGELAFLKIKRLANQAVTSDDAIQAGYTRAEDAPDRPVGYFMLDALFLGEGAERLNERQIEAIKQYVVEGGRLIIPGGANVPWLSVPAWQPVLPIRNASPKNYPSGVRLRLSNGGTVTVSDPITLMRGAGAPGTFSNLTSPEGEVTHIRPVGLGTVVFLGYNPFDEPLLSHPNRRQLVMDALRAGMFGSRMTLPYESAIGDNVNDPYGGVYASTTTTTGGGTVYIRSSGSAVTASGPESLYAHTQPPMSKADIGDTPFNVKLVPSSTVGWIFLGFFAAVIPLNFVVLRLMKRMEWAWVTAPLISILFAALLLSYSRGLYSAKFSRAYKGLVVQDIDSGLSSQWLKASFFMPQGGSYDLTLPQTDQIVPAAYFDGSEFRYYGRYYDELKDETIPVVDAGSASIPSVDVPNLAFRELMYHRPNAPLVPLEVDIQESKGRMQGHVKNTSPFALSRVALVCGEKTYVLPDLRPGQSYTLNDQTPTVPSVKPVISSGRRKSQAAIFALTDQFDPGGPGALEPKSTQVLLVWTKAVRPA